jgi:hypothetical protein
MGHEDEWILEEEYPGGSKQIMPRRSAVDDDDEGSYWVECVRNTADVYGDDEEEDAFEAAPQRAPRMTRNMVEDNAPKNTDSPLPLSDEHPMRTDEWLVEVHPRRRPHRSWFPCSSSTNTVSRGAVSQRFQFAPNGHVLLIEVPNNKQRRTRVGEWYMDYTGIKWDIPIWLEDTNHTPRQKRSPSSTKAKKSQTSSAKDLASQQEELWEDNVVAAALEAVTGDLSESTKSNSNNNNSNRRTGILHYHADIHLNKFGKQPRMFRGVVTRDRCSDKPHLFRPVLATFSAQGIGKDTVNVSYENRGFGLSKQQVDKK